MHFGDLFRDNHLRFFSLVNRESFDLLVFSDVKLTFALQHSTKRLQDVTYPHVQFIVTLHDV